MVNGGDDNETDDVYIATTTVYKKSLYTNDVDERSASSVRVSEGSAFTRVEVSW